jgi:adenosyl cobinamide kinase/adenosyl cobinamide phosphate guanylyltransferase
LRKLYDLHEGVARPLGAMTTQTQWPVVRSEGWFALALMANSKSGCMAVVDCLQNEEMMELLKATLKADTSSQREAEEASSSQIFKDRDNAFVLVQELLKNEVSSMMTFPTPIC